MRLGGWPGWSESSLGAKVICWLCHEAAHISLTFEQHTHRIFGTVYSMEWSLGAEFWNGALEWSGVKFWSGKNDWSCLNRRQNNTGALTWSHSLDVFICSAIFWWIEQKTFATPKFDLTPTLHSEIGSTGLINSYHYKFDMPTLSITRFLLWHMFCWNLWWKVQEYFPLQNLTPLHSNTPLQNSAPWMHSAGIFCIL